MVADTAEQQNWHYKCIDETENGHIVVDVYEIRTEISLWLDQNRNSTILQNVKNNYKIEV